MYFPRKGLTVYYNTIFNIQTTERRKEVENTIFEIKLLTPNDFCLILPIVSIVQSRERIEEFT